MSAHILTANDLKQGDVVYLTSSKEWSGYIADAALAVTEVELENLNSEGQVALKNCEVVDPHTVPVHLKGDQIIPNHIKERIRAQGPTTHLHFGKQAETQKVSDAFHSF